MHARSFKSKIIKTAFLAAALAFIAWSGSMGIAALANFRAATYLEAWQNLQLIKPGFKVADADFQKAQDASRLALKLAPYNSDYQITVADILLWQVLHTPEMPPATANSIRQEILQHYRAAIKQQPFWAYHYANYARTKARLGQIDADTMKALHEAYRLGPYEVDILHLIIDLGLYAWPQLDEPTRLLTASVIDKSLNWGDIGEVPTQREEVFALSTIGSYKRQAEICPMLKTKSAHITIMCRSIAKQDSTKARK